MEYSCVVDHNACRNCRRPIQKLEHIGWVHSELPQYAHEPLTCGIAAPVDVRCPFCGDLVPGQAVGGGMDRLSRHLDRYRVVCVGTGTLQPSAE